MSTPMHAVARASRHYKEPVSRLRQQMHRCPNPEKTTAIKPKAQPRRETQPAVVARPMPQAVPGHDPAPPGGARQDRTVPRTRCTVRRRAASSARLRGETDAARCPRRAASRSRRRARRGRAAPAAATVAGGPGEPPRPGRADPRLGPSPGRRCIRCGCSGTSSCRRVLVGAVSGAVLHQRLDVLGTFRAAAPQAALTGGGPMLFSPNTSCRRARQPPHERLQLQGGRRQLQRGRRQHRHDHDLARRRRRLAQALDPT